MLDQTLPEGGCIFPVVPQPMFNITEGWCLDAEGTLTGARPVDPEAVRLLCEPQPADLSTVNKDLLILMAAWSRRRIMDQRAILCCSRNLPRPFLRQMVVDSRYFRIHSMGHLCPIHFEQRLLLIE